jgi:hypothetical protein
MIIKEEAIKHIHVNQYFELFGQLFRVFGRTGKKLLDAPFAR